MSRFAGKVVLVTGATGGIGRATAAAFAREGAALALIGRRAAEGSETLRLVEQAGGSGIFLQADVSREAEARRVVAETVSRLGGLHAAFNNAGVEGPPALTADLAEEEFDRVMAINVKGVWACMKHQIPAMLQAGGGAIVNNASVGGLVGMPLSAAYSASKHAVIGLTRSVALEYAARGIRVNALAPGGVQTDMLDRATGGADSDGRAKMIRLHPMQRVARTEEMAGAVLWLCSDEASFVTGSVLAVDGGFTAR